MYFPARALGSPLLLEMKDEEEKKGEEKLNYHWMLVANRGLLGVTCKDCAGVSRCS